MEPISVVFYGKSGAGKGTQANLLVDYLTKDDSAREIIYLQTGKLLRELMERPEFIPQKVKQGLGNGELMPSFLPIYLWSREFINRYSGDEHIILDGLSRRAYESPVLENALLYMERPNTKVIVLDIAEEVAFERLRSRARYDDSDENIKERLKWYEENVTPAIAFFKDEGKFDVHTIDGARDEEAVHKEVLEILGV